MDWDKVLQTLCAEEHFITAPEQPESLALHRADLTISFFENFFKATNYQQFIHLFIYLGRGIYG